jgi:FlaA1/EpsC-like NDP-sugar epimerase
MSTPQLSIDLPLIARRFVPFHRWMTRSVQLAIFLFAGLSAFLLRFDCAIPGQLQRHLISALVIWALFKVAFFHVLSLDRGWWSYTSVQDLLRLIAGNAIASTAASVAILLLSAPGFPRSIYFLDFLLCLSMTAGIRLAVRVIYEIPLPPFHRPEAHSHLRRRRCRRHPPSGNPPELHPRL